MRHRATIMHEDSLNAMLAAMDINPYNVDGQTYSRSVRGREHCIDIRATRRPRMWRVTFRVRR